MKFVAVNAVNLSNESGPKFHHVCNNILFMSIVPVLSAVLVMVSITRAPVTVIESRSECATCDRR